MYFKSKKDIAEILDKLKSFVTVENGEGTVQDVIDAIEKLQADQETLQDVINDIIGELGGGEGETLAGLHTELDGIKANQTNGEQEVKQVGSNVLEQGIFLERDVYNSRQTFETTERPEGTRGIMLSGRIHGVTGTDPEMYFSVQGSNVPNDYGGPYYLHHSGLTFTSSEFGVGVLLHPSATEKGQRHDENLILPINVFDTGKFSIGVLFNGNYEDGEGFDLVLEYAFLQ